MDKEIMSLKYNKIYIFGANSRAKTLKGYLQFLYPNLELLSFLVDDMIENDKIIDNIKVQELRKVRSFDCTATIFIATKGIYHTDIQKRLVENGFHNIIPVTVEVDNFLRNEYVKKYYGNEGRPFVKLTDLSAKSAEKNLGVTIYIAKSIYDRPLQSVYIRPDYEKAIQVGAALTKERLEDCKLLDSTGENISEKNRQYCELTALYWMWKHATDDVIGLAHYRRHFVLPDNWVDIMSENSIDVVLPVPTYVSPSITENYMQRHDPTDWEFLIAYLQKTYPEDFALAKQVFDGNLYSPCNMFIMRREILNDLCIWMFPILDAVAEHGGTKEDTYLNRYPGFVSERLITLFFTKYMDKYRIAYADKTFIQ